MELIKVVAGRSSDHITLGGVEFEAAPLMIREYGEWLALGDADGGRSLDARAEFLAEKLRKRVKGTKTDPATITAEWIMDNVPISMLNTLEHLFIHGELPAKGGGTPKP